MNPHTLPESWPAPRGPNAMFTTCSPGYLAQASVLLASFARWNPGVDRYLLLVDKKDPAMLDPLPDAHVVWLEDLPLDHMHRHTMQFDVLELCTNLKALFFELLLARYPQVLFVDPDGKVYAPVDRVYECLASTSVLLSPAMLTPIDDGHAPDDLELLRVGAFNTGIVGVSATPTGFAFVRWWRERCLQAGFHETNAGVFVDQKWMDLVPAYFADHHILRDPGVNLACWNLHERRLSLENGRPIVNGTVPLVHFHFSSFDIDQPQQIARRQTRFAPGSRPDIETLLRDYANDLEAAGHRRCTQRPYALDHFDSGEYISPTLRRLYANPAYAFPEDENPHATNSSFYRFAKRHRLVSRAMRPAERMTAADASRHAGAMRMMGWLFKLTLRLLGPNRYFLLMRYLGMAASIRSQPPL